MTCQQCRQWWSPYMDSELDASKTFEVSEHLRLCESCRVRFERESAMDGWIRNSLSDVRVPAGLWNQIEADIKGPSVETGVMRSNNRSLSILNWLRPLAIAAVVALVLSAGWHFRDYFFTVHVVDVDQSRRVDGVSVAKLLEEATPNFRKFNETGQVDDGGAVETVASRSADVQRELIEMSRRLLGAEVTYESNSPHPHRVDFVAVYERTDDAGNPFIELHLNCCGRPTLLALALTDADTGILELNEATAKTSVTFEIGGRMQVPVQVRSESIDGVMVAAATARHYLDAIFAGIKVSKV
ncbi:MAG TPA: zf-HC2 domain-containing protein [Phycisphaerae bacterium]|nr:zf-HC2 domain-containing protein [Phycisphaerae bacterium]